MKKLIIFSFMLLASLSFACKSKKAVTNINKSSDKSSSTSVKLDSNTWRGTQDQIDPKIGVIKPLD